MAEPPRLEGWETADFVENREGRLSEGQARALGRRMAGFLLESLLFSIIWLGCGAWLVNATLDLPASGFGRIWWIGGLSLAAVCLLIAIAGPVRALRLRSEIRAGKVACTQGAVSRIYVTPQLWYGWVKIGDVKVGCWGAMWQRSWRAGLAYLRGAEKTRTQVRAYYLPSSNLFVAAEPA